MMPRPPVRSANEKGEDDRATRDAAPPWDGVDRRPDSLPPPPPPPLLPSSSFKRRAQATAGAGVRGWAPPGEEFSNRIKSCERVPEEEGGGRSSFFPAATAATVTTTTTTTTTTTVTTTAYAATSASNATVGASSSSFCPQPVAHLPRNDWGADLRGLEFTPRDEEREWAAVTASEMLEIDSDLRGLTLPSSSERKKKAQEAPPPRLPPPLLPPALPPFHGTAVAASSGRADGRSRADNVSLLFDEMDDDEKEISLLPALEASLASVPDAEKGAYLEARRRCPELVDDDHKRAFLWREGYDPERAAARLVRHWTFKRKLFGPVKCYLPMTLSGAMSDDLITLSVGFVHLLPERDERGRNVMLFRQGRHDPTKYSRESMMRVMWYLYHVATLSPSDRRRGIVYILNNRGMTWQRYDPATYRSLLSIPFKYANSVGRSIHYCHPGHLFHNFVPFFKLLLGERLRKRFVVHSGSTEDVRLALARYGLGPDVVPSDLGGRVELNPVRWLSERMTAEALADGWGKEEPLACEATWSGHGQTEARERRRSSDDAWEFENIFDEDIPSPSSNRSDRREETPSSAARSGDPPPRRPGKGSAAAKATATKKTTNHQRSDARMVRAVEAKTNDPGMSLLDALIAGGYEFPVRPSSTTTGQKNNDKSIKDAEGVSLFQRKNHLCRKLRKQRNAAAGGGPDAAAKTAMAAAAPVASDDAAVGEVPKRGGGGGGGDARMARAVDAKLSDPTLTLLEALVAGGFAFPGAREGRRNNRDVRDEDGVLLYQRKNQLCRRLRDRRKEDPRMGRAAAAARNDPSVSLVDALLEGGFVFPKLGAPGFSDKMIRDEENVTLFTRKNELKKKLEGLAKAKSVRKESELSLGDEANRQTSETDLVGSNDASDESHPNRSSQDSEQSDQLPQRTEEPRSHIGGGNQPPTGERIIERSDSFERSIAALPGLDQLLEGGGPDDSETEIPGLSQLQEGDGSNNGESLDSSAYEENEPIMGSWLWRQGTDTAPDSEDVNNSISYF